MNSNEVLELEPFRHLECYTTCRPVRRRFTKARCWELQQRGHSLALCSLCERQVCWLLCMGLLP